MKRIFLICGIILLSGHLIAELKASIVNNWKSVNGIVLSDTKIVKILEEKLPQTIKDALKNDIDKGWKIDDIYLIKEDPEFYQITLKKDITTKIKNLDKNGKLVISKN